MGHWHLCAARPPHVAAICAIMMWLEVRRALPKARTPSRGRRRPRPAQGNAAGGTSLALEMRSPRVAAGALSLAPLRVGGGGAREWGSGCSFPKISLIILRWPFYDVDLCIALKFAIKVYPAVAIRQLHSEMDPSPGPPKCLTKYRLCKVCGRPLVKIGTARANGAQHHGDWWGRATHKQCFKAMQPKRRKKGGKRPTFRVGCKHKRFF